MNQQEKKIDLEITSLELGIKHKKAQYSFDILKYVLACISAAFVFFLITRPDTLLNRRASEETIARERAKLLIDILKEKDPELRKQGLAIIKGAYPTDNQWIVEIENKLNIHADIELEENRIKEHEDLLRRRDDYLNQRKGLKVGSDDYQIVTTKIELINKMIKSIAEKSNNK